ncbi:MAG: hypothetical protein ACP5SH_13565 [Syntrophobacteraceae bacterium]
MASASTQGKTTTGNQKRERQQSFFHNAPLKRERQLPTADIPETGSTTRLIPGLWNQLKQYNTSLPHSKNILLELRPAAQLFHAWCPLC